MHTILLLFFVGLLPLARHNAPISAHVIKHVAVPANYPVFKFDSANAPSLSDSLFLITAYYQNEFEIRAARLAHKQSGDPKVKGIAFSIKKDHQTLANSLQALLIKKGYSMPGPTLALQAKFKYLNQWMGKDFNMRYANGNDADTKGDIAFYTLFLYSAKDAELKKFASNALTVLQADKDSIDKLIVHINTPSKSSW